MVEELLNAQVKLKAHVIMVSHVSQTQFDLRRILLSDGDRRSWDLQKKYFLRHLKKSQLDGSFNPIIWITSLTRGEVRNLKLPPQLPPRLYTSARKYIY